MAADLRRLGRNIEKASKDIYDNVEDFAKNADISTSDVYRLFEGRLILNPLKLKEISKVVKKPLCDLLNTDGEYVFVECMGNFKDKNNEDKILDIIDSYVDLVEAIS